MTWWAAALGAAVGAPCRYLVDAAVSARFGRGTPWGTLAVNLLGSAGAGVLGGALVGREVDLVVVSLLGAGFLGAFTTMSAFAFEVVALAEQGRRRVAMGTVLLSVAGGVALAYIGLWLGLRL